MRAIKGYYARYWVTKLGDVYDLLRFKKVKQEMSKYGYMVVRLLEYPFEEPALEYDSNGWSYCRRDILVHRLVAETYIKRESPWWTIVNHMNCVNIDNSVCNLEWVSPKENVRHAYVMGRYNGGKFGHKISYFSTYSVTTDKGVYNKYAGIKNGKVATGYMNKGSFYPSYKSHNHSGKERVVKLTWDKVRER